MNEHSKRHRLSETTHGEAMRIARGTQRPGQTKEQTRLIAQGIQKGIEQYKKQQNARARELDKKLKKFNQKTRSPDIQGTTVQETVIYKQHWLPWVLLILTWLVIVAYWFIHEAT
jgi:hypothetical protein